MRLQYALTMNDPKSVDVAARQTSQSSSTGGLSRMDILTALGYLQSKERAGLALMYTKYTKDRGEHKRAVAEVTKESRRLTIKLVGKMKGRDSAVLWHTLAQLVVMEYARTPDSPGAKCRCGGSGRVADPDKLTMLGASARLEDITKECERCKGTGMKPIPASRVYRAISAINPELAQHTYYRHWAPIYADLLAYCYEQEDRAEQEYRKITLKGPTNHLQLLRIGVD